jgi:hypothetical protein
MGIVDDSCLKEHSSEAADALSGAVLLKRLQGHRQHASAPFTVVVMASSQLLSNWLRGVLGFLACAG